MGPLLRVPGCVTRVPGRGTWRGFRTDLRGAAWTPIRGTPACVWAVALFPHLMAHAAMARAWGPHGPGEASEGAWDAPLEALDGDLGSGLGALAWPALAAGPEAQGLGNDPAFRAFVRAWVEAPRWSTLPPAVQDALASGPSDPSGPPGPSGAQGPSGPKGAGPKGPGEGRLWGPDADARVPDGVTTLAEDAHGRGVAVTLPRPRYVAVPASRGCHALVAWTPGWARWRRALASFPGLYASPKGPEGRGAPGSFPPSGPIPLGVAYQGEFISPGTLMPQAHEAWYVLMPSGTQWPAPPLARWTAATRPVPGTSQAEGLDGSPGGSQGEGRDGLSLASLSPFSLQGQRGRGAPRARGSEGRARRGAEAWVRAIRAVGPEAEAWCAQVRAEEEAHAAALSRAVKRGVRAPASLALAQVRGTSRLAWGSRALNQAWAQVQAVAEGFRALNARRAREASGRRRGRRKRLGASVRPVQVHPDDPRFEGWVKVSKRFLEAFLGIPLDRAMGGHPAVAAEEARWTGHALRPSGPSGASGSPVPKSLTGPKGQRGPQGPRGEAGASEAQGLSPFGPVALPTLQARARRARALMARVHAWEAKRAQEGGLWPSGPLSGQGAKGGRGESEAPQGPPSSLSPFPPSPPSPPLGPEGGEGHEGQEGPEGRKGALAKAFRAEVEGEFGTPTFFLVGGLEAYRGLGYVSPSPLRPMPATRVRHPMGPFRRPIPVPRGQRADEDLRFGTRVPSTFLTVQRSPRKGGRRPRDAVRWGRFQPLPGARRAAEPRGGRIPGLEALPFPWGPEGRGGPKGEGAPATPRPLTSLGFPGTARWRPWRSPRAWVHTEWRHRPTLTHAYDRFEAILAARLTASPFSPLSPFGAVRDFEAARVGEADGAPKATEGDRPSLALRTPWVATPLDAFRAADADPLGLDGAGR